MVCALQYKPNICKLNQDWNLPKKDAIYRPCGESFYFFFPFLSLCSFPPETKNPLMMQMIDFLRSFSRKLHSIFISLVDFDWCGLRFLKLAHPLVSRQIVTLRLWARLYTHISSHFSSLFLLFKKWWMCKNAVFNKDIWIHTFKRCYPHEIIMLGQPTLNNDNCF